MLARFQLKDRTVRIMNREIPVTVGHQKRMFEGIPMVGGFLFDIATLSRIDQLWSLIQQIIFIILIFFFLYLENVPIERRTRFKIIWKYYDYILQFLFGGLLSAYSIFYFKSASGFLVGIFAVTLFVLMVINESRRFHALQYPIRYVLASLCLCSFLVYLFPIIFHWMNWFTFLLSISASFFLFLWVVDQIHKKISWKEQPKRRRAIWGGAVPVVFGLLYFLQVIPPVPLSCEELGIYHQVKRQGDTYELSYLRPAWKFWQNDDRVFLYRPGDQVNVFTSVFAPSKLEHNIRIRWEKKDAESRWQTTDIIPMAIKGGRDEGFRGVANKQSVSPGVWRVKIETEEGRELQRLRFKIQNDPNPGEERQFRIKKS